MNFGGEKEQCERWALARQEGLLNVVLSRNFHLLQIAKYTFIRFNFNVVTAIRAPSTFLCWHNSGQFGARCPDPWLNAREYLTTVYGVIATKMSPCKLCEEKLNV